MHPAGRCLLQPCSCTRSRAAPARGSGRGVGRSWRALRPPAIRQLLSVARLRISGATVCRRAGARGPQRHQGRSQLCSSARHRTCTLCAVSAIASSFRGACGNGELRGQSMKHDHACPCVVTALRVLSFSCAMKAGNVSAWSCRATRMAIGPMVRRERACPSTSAGASLAS